MKLAILSDIHANLEALRATLDHATAHGADRIICLGDIVGYNTDPDECVALLRQHDPLCVAGNHDRAVTGQIGIETFSPVAARAAVWTRERIGAETRDYLAALPLKAHLADTLVIVHGALHPEAGCELVYLDNDESRRQSFDALAAHPSGARICAFGHTHRAAIFERCGDAVREIDVDDSTLHEDAYYLVNPGTVGEPRSDDRRATYFLYDAARRHLALQRVDYDASVPFAKTRRAGLARPFSFLPRSLRKTLVSGMRAAGLYGVVKRVAG
jgi:predicted phosphodiesterase